MDGHKVQEVVGSKLVRGGLEEACCSNHGSFEGGSLLEEELELGLCYCLRSKDSECPLLIFLLGCGYL